MDFIASHSNWAFVTVVLLIVAVIDGFTGVIMKRRFSGIDHKIALYTMVATHLQLVLGIIVYMKSGFTQAAMQDMSAAMGDSTLRLFAVEHPFAMILGVLFLTLGFIFTKREEKDRAKFMKIVIFYTIGGLFILGRIPWAYWGH